MDHKFGRVNKIRSEVIPHKIDPATKLKVFEGSELTIVSDKAADNACYCKKMILIIMIVS